MGTIKKAFLLLAATAAGLLGFGVPAANAEEDLSVTSTTGVGLSGIAEFELDGGVKVSPADAEAGTQTGLFIVVGP